MCQKIHYMQDSVKVGELGEKAVMDFLLTKNYVQNYLDVRGDKTYWEKDVDYFVMFIDKSCHPIEIKTDTYSHTGNIFYEDISCIERNTPGCFQKTKARWLFYYFVNDGTLYIIHVKKFREWYEGNKHRFRTTTVTNEILDKNRRHTGKFFHSSGHLIPRAEIELLDCVRKHHIDNTLSQIA